MCLVYTLLGSCRSHAKNGEAFRKLLRPLQNIVCLTRDWPPPTGSLTTAVKLLEILLSFWNWDQLLQLSICSVDFCTCIYPLIHQFLPPCIALNKSIPVSMPAFSVEIYFSWFRTSSGLFMHLYYFQKFSTMFIIEYHLTCSLSPNSNIPATILQCSSLHYRVSSHLFLLSKLQHPDDHSSVFFATP